MSVLLHPFRVESDTSGGPLRMTMQVISGAVGTWLTLRGMCSLILTRGVRSATNAYDRRQPNLIVASGFGAVIARRIARPKTPLVYPPPTLRKVHTEAHTPLLTDRGPDSG